MKNNAIDEMLEGYNKNNIHIATICSHSSLQIFDGAKQEGFKTLGIRKEGSPVKFYEGFPLAKPDDYFVVKDYTDLLDRADELIEKNTIIIPHGSFVRYMGSENFFKLKVPTFGNREVLKWESDRSKQREWLNKAIVKTPSIISKPEEIKNVNGPVIVKYHGAGGGTKYFIALDKGDFEEKIEKKEHIIQEYIVGTRYYIHYFYSPLKNKGYKLSKGVLELRSIDRRDETNVDELYKIASIEKLRETIPITFTVTGNLGGIVLRESLLPKAFEMGSRVVEKSLELFGGMIGPFSLETIVTEEEENGNRELKFYTFELSARIVAGTNPYPRGSPYTPYIEEENMSMGRRIAREINVGLDSNRLHEILS